jgi:glutamate formiminotransferase/formiminotetrahydrofolate cyclodeaminase
MNRLVECVPNFSEGRKAETVNRLVRAVESVAGAYVLGVHMDGDHNRSVITFVVEPEAAVEAAVRVVAEAAKWIDLRQHVGQHPRVGATDVLPFVPLSGVTMEECVALAHAAGVRIADELGIPVYFYERAARRPDRVNLEDVRRGGFETLRDEIATRSERAPDAGAPRLHPSAGAVIVGARPLLIAFNVMLRTTDAAVARRIARAVRGRNGGLRYLKAIGIELKERGLAQVSMNLVDYEKTSLHHAVEAVRREAQRYGVQVAGSEIVGLVPQAALDRSAEYYLQIENFHPNLILENRLRAVLERRAEASAQRHGESDLPAASLPFRVPAPPHAAAAGTVSGGAAAAQAANLAATLGEMVARLTESRWSQSDEGPGLRDALGQLTALRARLEEAADEDELSVERVAEAHQLPQSTEDERRERATWIEAALKGAANAPLETAGLALQVLELLETLAEIGDPEALPDVAAGAQLALAAVAAARYKVLAHTTAIEDDEFVSEHRSRADDLYERATEIAASVETLLMDSID